jgi:hypothetical protein
MDEIYRVPELPEVVYVHLVDARKLLTPRGLHDHIGQNLIKHGLVCILEALRV